MLRVFLVLATDVLEHLGVRHDLRVDRHAERARDDLRIVEPDVHVETAERLACQALGGPQRLAVRMAAEVEP